MDNSNQVETDSTAIPLGTRNQSSQLSQTPEDTSSGKASAIKRRADQLQIPWLETLNGYSISPQYVERFRFSYAKEHLLIAVIDKEGNRWIVAGREESFKLADVICRSLAKTFRLAACSDEQILAAIHEAYASQTDRTSAAIHRLDDDAEIDLDLTGETGGVDLLESTDHAPVIELVNSILFDAINSRASDIHIQPYEQHLQVRFRIDGMLFDQFRIDKSRQENILSRIKILGRMDIAEKRMPQDGRATARVGQRVVDLRVASLPTSYGERIVIRLLDKGSRLYTLNELGMSNELLTQFRKLIHREHGIILVTGPTGSGKSTTLYAALGELDVKNTNVLTLEDPIEYQLDGISQTQINEKKGLTFASGLRNVLRQDPDVIMVGEIRDEETAKMAIQSALTGHLVFSTLHTNDAASAVTRLLELGIEPFLVSSSVIGVLAQRLVRKICEHCKTEIASESNSGAASGKQSGSSFVGTGCKNCRQTGYRGRVGLFELMTINESVRSLIHQHANASEIRNSAQQSGMKLLRSDGIEKSGRGITTESEVLRVSQSDD